MARDATVYVAGHAGLAGSAIWRHLESQGFTNLVGMRSKKLDLRDRDATRDFFAQVRPAYVIDAAARVGGILANDAAPADFLSDNLRIQLNLIDASARVRRHPDCCSSDRAASIRDFPRSRSPRRPDDRPRSNRPTQAYATAKIAGIAHVQAVRRQYGRPFVCGMPTNLYGPGDNFDPDHLACTTGADPAHATKLSHGVRCVKCHHMGDPASPRREFLHAG